MLTANVQINETSTIINIYDDNNLIAKANLISEQRIFTIKFAYFNIKKLSGRSFLLNKSGLSVMNKPLNAGAQIILAETIKKELYKVEFITISEIESLDKFIETLELQVSLCKPNESNLVNYKLNLIDGFQEYLNKSNSKVRREFLREVRRLYNFFDTDVEIKSLRDEEHISQFMKDCTEIYNESWKEGKIDRIQTASLQRYVRNSEWLGYVLYAKKEPIAFYHGIVRDKQYLLISNGYKSAYRTYAPGKVLLYKILEHSDAEKYNIIDFGSGTSQYKKHFANECHEIYSAYLAKTASKFGAVFMIQALLDESYKWVKTFLKKMKIDVYARRMVRGG